MLTSGADISMRMRRKSQSEQVPVTIGVSEIHVQVLSP